MYCTWPLPYQILSQDEAWPLEGVCMSIVDDRLKHVTLKVKRAYEHIAACEQQLQMFLESRPYKVGAKRDPKNRKLIYYVESVEPIPDCIPLIVGDAIQNLMSALDHLAYQIVCNDTGDKPPNPKNVYFPIADNVTKYVANKHRKMEGARQQSFDAIDALKPYKSGNDQLWTLHKLNNIEKHRMLLTSGSQAGGINACQLMAVQISSTFPPEDVAALGSMNAIFLVPTDNGFPLTAGFELYIGGVDEKPHPKQQFIFDVVLSEPGVIEGKPILETLNQFAKLVDDIVATLSPLVKERRGPHSELGI